jgi:hypothetical protein
MLRKVFFPSAAVLGGTIRPYLTHAFEGQLSFSQAKLRQNARLIFARQPNAFVLHLALKELLESLEIGLNPLYVKWHQDGAEYSKEPHLREIDLKAIGES